MVKNPAVTLLLHTPDPELTVALAARLCYSPAGIAELKTKLEASDVKMFVQKIIDLGHHSVLEHVNFTFGIEGVSRALSHQLVRHRVGVAFSQQSQRYVKLVPEGELSYIEPKTLAGRAELQAKFQAHMAASKDFYGELLSAGIPAEDARYVLPNAVETRLIMTMNARELLHFFTMRCCTRAQWEIRHMADQMLVQAYAVAPVIFGNAGPSCVNGPCSEGKMCCGKPRSFWDILDAA